jgi:4-amino-4-deoxy-L-arabinose transferase-like glycosyltransferase
MQKYGEEAFSRKELIVGFWVFLLCSLALRFYHLDFSSLSFDELSVTNLAIGSLANIFEARVGDMNPPFYDTIIMLVFKIFGVGDWAALAVSALAGSLAPAFLFLLSGKRFGRIPAVLAATFLTFSPFAILYSQVVRPYALMMLFSVIYFFLGWDLFRDNKESHWGRPIGLVLSGAILLNLHYSSAFFLAASCLVWTVCVLATNRRRLLLLIVSHLLIIASFSYWLPNFIGEALEWPSGVYLYGEYQGIWLILMNTVEGSFSYPLFGFVVMLLALAGVIALGFRGRSKVLLDLSLIALVPVLFLASILAIIAHEKLGIFRPNYAIVTWPVALLAISLGISGVVRRTPGCYAAALLIAFISSYYLFDRAYYANIRGGDYRGMAKRIVELGSTEGALPIVSRGYGRHLDYYLKLMGSPLRISYKWPKQASVFYQSPPDEFWLVTYDNFISEPKLDVNGEFPGYRYRKEAAVSGLDLYLLKRRTR